MPSSGCQTCALRSEEHTSELQSHDNLGCRLLLEKTNSRRMGPTSPGQLLNFRGSSISDTPAPSTVITLLVAVTPAPRTPHSVVLFFFNDTATTEIYTLSLHDALPI